VGINQNKDAVKLSDGGHTGAVSTKTVRVAKNKLLHAGPCSLGLADLLVTCAIRAVPS
jgi:hypothetical protein